MRWWWATSATTRRWRCWRGRGTPSHSSSNTTRQPRPSCSSSSAGAYHHPRHNHHAHFIIIYRRYIPEFEPQGSEEVPNSCSDDDGPFPHSQTSQLVPDSPCSVSSDCSGSWIGIPRSDYRLLSVISSVPMLLSTLSLIVLYFIVQNKEELDRCSDGSAADGLHDEV